MTPQDRNETLQSQAIVNRPQSEEDSMKKLIILAGII
jgi:hypothetical protein